MAVASPRLIAICHISRTSHLITSPWFGSLEWKIREALVQIVTLWLCQYSELENHH